MHSQRTMRMLLPFLALTLAACGSVTPESSAKTDGETTPGAVTLNFAHLVNGAPVVLGTDTPSMNAAGNMYGVSRLSYFVSDVTLHMVDGRQMVAAGAHYVDCDTAESLSYALPIDLPTGELSSVSFVMGLPPALNVSGAFGSPPESLMEWPVPMGGGYHYLKFEGRYLNTAAAPFNFMMHSGGLGGIDYAFTVDLDASKRSIPSEGATLIVQMNLERWFGDWDLNDYFNMSRHGIMGDAAAQASLKEHGATVFTLGAP